ncbi:metallophosphoesterase family protein [Cohnella soli]|uniref:Metallophosphoesterase family protein n=1 Tax=Cohnella soli TaxID=425005 RepID=A0ABW0HW84_9BACL
MNRTMKFREDGSFTIIQFTDVHWQEGGELDRQSEAVMRTVLDNESADLVVFTGDLVYPSGKIDPKESLRQAVAEVVKRGLPWAYVFGNHDTERHITRSELIEAAIAEPYCVAERGPVQLTGEGNYVIEIANAREECKAALYFMDSGNVSPLLSVDGYDWIRRDQIDWYEKESRALAERSGVAAVPALAFFHIPLPEYDEVWKAGEFYGTKLEQVCCPKVNSGLFTAMLERGDVMGTFCGHDHVNDYWGNLHGIRLCYGRATGLNTYGRDDFEHGARIIRLQEGQPGFETWLRLGTGE